MPNPNTSVFSFAAAFIGDAAPNTAQLSRIVDLRTNGATISSSIPTEHLVVTKNDVQTGNQIVQVRLSFYSTSDLMVRLAKGISITGDPDGTPAAQKYSLLLLAPSDSTRDSYYFPDLKTEKIYNIDVLKDAAKIIEIKFEQEDPSVAVKLMRKGTYAELKAIMGSRSPY